MKIVERLAHEYVECVYLVQGSVRKTANHLGISARKTREILDLE